MRSKKLQSFIDYCDAHPELRFWQALYSWSKYDFILVASKDGDWNNFNDPFYIEDDVDDTRDQNM